MFNTSDGYVQYKYYFEIVNILLNYILLYLHKKMSNNRFVMSFNII